MFAPYCPDHGSRILLSESSIVDMTRTAEATSVTLECHCGARLTVEVPREAALVRAA